MVCAYFCTEVVRICFNSEELNIIFHGKEGLAYQRDSRKSKLSTIEYLQSIKTIKKIIEASQDESTKKELLNSLNAILSAKENG